MALSTAQRAQAHLSGESADNAQKYNFELAAVSHVPVRSQLANMTAGFLTVTNVAYWVYIGQTTRQINANFIRFFVTASGVGTKVQELVVAHSVSAPDRAAKTITVDAVANATGDYVAGTGSFVNTTSMAYKVPAGQHLWLGCRFALTSTPTQPTLAALGIDSGKGEILSTAAAGVLAVGATYTGAIISQSTTLTAAMCPDLVLSAS